jgi:hypothetical protein
MNNRFAIQVLIGTNVGAVLGFSIENLLMGIWMGIIFVITLYILLGSPEPGKKFK